MFNIGETDVDFLSLLSWETHSILVDLEISLGFLSDEIGPNDKVVETFFADRFQ